MVGMGVVIVVLEVWARPPGWLRNLRAPVVDGLHWIRVHWLTSSSVGVAVALLAVLLGISQRRSERQRAEREQAERTNMAQAARRALLAAHCWVDLDTNDLPRVSAVRDPVMLGVHPAAAVEDLDATEIADDAAGGLGLSGRVPVYVPRDLDAGLDAALARGLAHGGLVLLRGDSTAGKSRTAFEAMRRLPGDLRLLVPTHRGSLRALLDGGVELREVVVWLNDLERYLGADGLDVSLLRRLVGTVGQQVLVVATMRAREYNARSPDRERDHPASEREVLRAERELLDQAVDLELPRRFSAAEHQRAGERNWDPRIADALTHAGQYGLAEYLAAGPRLWRRWRNARAVDNPEHEQAGAAIVAAALDCRRAGLRRPAPVQLLHELFRDPAYLDPLVAGRLSPDAFGQGLAWARTPVQATSALLTPDDAGDVVFDYLLDTLQADPDTPPVPRRVWERLLTDLDPGDGFDIGSAAYQADQPGFAELAWREAADAGDHRSGTNLGIMLHEQGDLEGAEPWLRRAADAGSHLAENGLGVVFGKRGDLEEAERWYGRAASAGDHGAQRNLGLLLAQRGDLEEAERWLRPAAEASFADAQSILGVTLAQRGDLVEAERWFRCAADAGDHDAEAALGLLCHQRDDLEEAERWYRRAADAGDHDAEYSLGTVFMRRGDVEEAERWYRRATDAGNHDAEYGLGLLLTVRGGLGQVMNTLHRGADDLQRVVEQLQGGVLSRRGDMQEAERVLRRAADAGHHRAEELLGVLLAHWGDLEEAERLLRRAADAGDQDADQMLGRLLANLGDLREGGRHK